jgi:hypothetical protein
MDAGGGEPDPERGYAGGPSHSTIRRSFLSIGFEPSEAFKSSEGSGVAKRFRDWLQRHVPRDRGIEWPVDLERHRQYAADSTAWLTTGQRLLSSADVLWSASTDYFEAVNRAFELAFPRTSDEVRTSDGVRTVDLPAEIEAELLEGPSHALAFLLLAGYAIENLLKAVHVRRKVLAGELVVDADGALIGISMTHNLSELARRVFGVGELSEGEQQILRRLSLIATWSGRYPVARRMPDSNDWIAAFASSGNDHREIHNLCERVIRLHASLR